MPYNLGIAKRTLGYFWGYFLRAVASSAPNGSCRML
jgi:hypothetical protein